MNEPKEPPPDWTGIKSGFSPGEEWIWLIVFVCAIIVTVLFSGGFI